jgi:predicted TPR repeat methyltransferase
MSTPQTQADPIVARLQVISDLIAQGSHKEAAAELNATHKSFPTDPRPFLLGARSAEAAGNVAGAIELIQRAIRLTPQWSVAVTELAMLLSRDLRVDEAMDQARKAIKLDPANTDVLFRVIDLAHRLNQPKQALEWLTRAAVLSPETLNLRFLIARDQYILGDYAQAILSFDEYLFSNPTDSIAVLGRAQAAIGAGDLALAKQDMQTLLQAEPWNDVYTFWSEVAAGNTPTTMPAQSVLDQFDTGRADLYEKFVDDQGYQLPKLAADWVRERYPTLELNVLDLGCGTGLLGAKLGRISGALVGVDLSNHMVEQAAKHEVYDKVHTVNVLDALAATPDALYNVVSACEVFPFVGSLTDVVEHAYRLILAGGHFIFSCEAAPEAGADLVLRNGLRFQHKLSHVQSLCQAAGFDDIETKTLTLFTDNDQPVEGFAIIARKPA